MESIYDPKLWKASDNLNLNDYFNNYSKLLSKTTTKKSSEYEIMKKLMNKEMSEEEYEQLKQKCSPDLLTCRGENTKSFPMDKPTRMTSKTQLPEPYITSTDQNQLNLIKCKKKLEKEKPLVSLLLNNKTNYYNEIPFPKCDLPPDLIPLNEFIVHIIIYKPFSFNYHINKNTSDKLRFACEMLALGSNTLAEVRDRILCSLDVGLCKEVENTKVDLKEFSNAKEKYPSGTIFIDNTFYNDLREPNAIDYSIPLIQWARSQNIDNLKTERIENFKVKDLKPRLGYPYVYIHQGNCEHLLVFSDARLIQSYDCLNSISYPHIWTSNKIGNIMCFLCGVSCAKWICIDSDRFPQEKAFLCTECCESYNFIDQKKIGNFRLYPFYEKHPLV